MKRFRGAYNFNRFRYIHQEIVSSNHFDIENIELIPKTACFFSDDIIAYIDTSDGVNDDLEIQEYCGRILRCVKEARGKRFLFFKAAHSHIRSKNIEEIALENNGKVIPFFKWSFNNNFYSHVLPNLRALREKSSEAEHDYDIGLFADFNKKYTYPRPSHSDKRISWADHKKFGLEGSSHDTGTYEIASRPFILDRLKKSDYNIYVGSQPYPEYLSTSMSCQAILNPPGVGEYTSRMMDQTAVGNLIILRKNSYDQGHSWKEYIPEIDFNSHDWQEAFHAIIEDRVLWIEKGQYYYENLWSPRAIFNFMMTEINQETS